MESAEIQTQPGCEKKNILMLFIPIIFTLGKCATVKNISEPPLKAVFPLKWFKLNSEKWWVLSAGVPAELKQPLSWASGGQAYERAGTGPAVASVCNSY